jgi:hypothetical protein
MKHTPIISTTGEVHGWGSHPYKWVSYLTPDERAAVRRGSLVVFAVDGGHPPYRKVIYSPAYGYTHRVPDASEQAAIEQSIANARGVECPECDRDLGPDATSCPTCEGGP